METILNTLPQLIWLKDSGGVYKFANRTWLRSFGFSTEEVIGRTDFDLWDERDAEKFTNRDQMVMESKRSLVFREWTPENKGNPAIFFETQKIPLIDDFGECIGTVGIATDLTASKELDVAIEEAVLDLKAMYGKKDAA